MFAHDGDRLPGGLHATRDLHVLGTGEFEVPDATSSRAAQSTSPFHICPAKDERGVVQVAHLQELPDHHRFEHRADPARGDDEGVGHQHELVQAGEEGLVLEGLLDERVDLLLERQLDADADALDPLGRARSPARLRWPPASGPDRRR
ncbi:MAG: hypothetical protein MZV65_18395 [Chromatiales bacterium]|nr:hypothetical protein [Chromatiales bacterium]